MTTPLRLAAADADLLAARMQMELALGWHIVLACFRVGFPIIVLVADSVHVDGQPVDHDTGPIVWGQPGTNGQHAAYQPIHQGTTLSTADFIAVARADIAGHHDLLMANYFAQTEALAFGKTRDEVAADGVAETQQAHRVFSGNEPTSTMLLPALTPSTLGQLVACYEHTVFTQGTIWDTNAFDQWGVELGKVLADVIAKEFTNGEAAGAHDRSTTALIDRYRQQRRDGGVDR